MRDDKSFLLKEVEELMEKHSSFVIAEYSGIQANAMGRFRDEVAKLGGAVHMMKKRIFLKAAQEAGLEFTHEQLKGHLSLIFSGDDAIETTKATFQFSQENKEGFNVLGGRIDNRLYSAEEVETLSKLPGIQEMRAQLLGVLQAPLQQTLGTMQALLTSVIYCLKNKSEKESE